jgi:hypothetical protein
MALPECIRTWGIQLYRLVRPVPPARSSQYDGDKRAQLFIVHDDPSGLVSGISTPFILNSEVEHRN